MLLLALLALLVAGGAFLASKHPASVKLRNRLAILRTRRNCIDGANSLIQRVQKDPSAPAALTKEEVIRTFTTESWQSQAYSDWASIHLDAERIFPCIYATKGFKSDEHLFVFLDSDDLGDSRHIQAIASGLMHYLPRAHALGPNTSLVVLTKYNNNTRTVEEYNVLFWKLLDGLARLDKVAWPADIPKDIDTERWAFSFNGEHVFAAVQTPAHQQRLSRHANSLTVAFQPKWVFDLLFSTDAKRESAKTKVRRLLSKYDTIPVSPLLANYGDEGTREFQQYFLMDENVPAPCPFKRLAADVDPSKA
ncbi:hypothetical protein EW026_g5525 [Hermanssonia centrifuga]|uniref:Uncharacterized protein n=1 Tax=Hermanssonia centrifuga TaxID=98765 RepID=A0A4S4KDW9_9APHY|nr:hypothetical protein EW026_g5525 [Hermanssonia centrifuga]